MKWISSFLMTVGRFLLGLVFFWAAIEKVANYDAMTQLVAAKGIEYAPLVLISACVVEFLGSFSLIFGYKVRFGALMLIVYLALGIGLFHAFWSLEPGLERQWQVTAFIRDIALIGGLLYVLACGAKCCEAKKSVE